MRKKMQFLTNNLINGAIQSETVFLANDENDAKTHAVYHSIQTLLETKFKVTVK